MEPDESAQRSIEVDRIASEQMKLVAEEEERRRKEAEKRKAELEAMSPEQRDIAALRDPSITEERAVEIYVRIDDVSGENRTAVAQALKEYWIAQGKWQTKNCSNKQRSKVQKIKTILGENP
jgi:hypothetical protein